MPTRDMDKKAIRKRFEIFEKRQRCRFSGKDEDRCLATLLDIVVELIPAESRPGKGQA